MVNCPGCGAVNTEDAEKCATCGRALQIICSCGCKNSLNAAICNQCGKVLDNNSESDGKQNNLSDPVNEMFESKTDKPKESSSPKKAIILLVLGLFIFGLLYLSKICDGHPYILLIGGLVSGIIALIGLIELTFGLLMKRIL
jgi:uncharacterized membrane protein YvbJ